MNTNLSNWFGGSARTREFRETRNAWDEAERLWRNTPAAKIGISELARALVRVAIDRAPRAPALPILVELCVATDELLRAEDITAIEPLWSVIEGDVEVAIHVRKMLARRKRWGANFEGMLDIVGRQLLAGYADLFAALPESCFGEWDPEGASFGVPLAELLNDPADFIERLLMFAYDDETLKFDLFLRYRERLAANLLMASGFRPDDNIHERSDRLILPTARGDKSPAELVRLYLGGTPFEALLELPVPFEVPEQSRFEHCHIVGGTGHGKTQLMQGMIYSDLVAAAAERRAVVVIDSQGDLIGKLRRLEVFSPDVDGSLADRLVVIDPADVEFPASLNLFDAHIDRVAGYRLVDQERVLNGVVELYETFFGDLLGAELTQKQGVIFKYLARLMLTIPGATIHTLMQLMEDGKPFRHFMDQLDGSARYFFQKEFFDPSFSATKKQILKRLWGVLSTPAFERMFAQPTNKLDLFQALQDGKIILVSTAKDLLKREGSQLFGRFFIAMLAQAALERSTVPEDERTPTMVYVDEAQEYFDDNVETILNQARKYNVGLTLAHQTLDQLTPRLRSVLNANTSMKCVGGVSAKDARTLADDLHTDSDFIESMKRRGGRTEFAVWLKHQTPRAIRVSVPLGFLERQPTLSDEAFDELQDRNRAQYCGTLAEARLALLIYTREPAPEPTPPARERIQIPEPELWVGPAVEPTDDADAEPFMVQPARAAPRPRPPVEERELGKGGPKHRYLQSLVKQLAEAQGFRATIEAPLKGCAGQVDVLLERQDLTVAVEVSVTTPVEQERENVKKCLTAGYGRVALVLVKSKKTQGRYQEMIVEGLSTEERARVSFLAPEDVPDFIAALAAPAEPTEKMVKGYRVTVSRTALSPEEAKARRAQIVRVITQSMRGSG